MACNDSSTSSIKRMMSCFDDVCSSCEPRMVDDTRYGIAGCYLGEYFTQPGITYNAYINRLRIEHFVRLYNETKDSTQPITAKKLAQKSGFRSYITFSSAFKLYMGTTVTKWMKNIT